jgi:WD40-like Beta Propeller Repeat
MLLPEIGRWETEGYKEPVSGRGGGAQACGGEGERLMLQGLILVLVMAPTATSGDLDSPPRWSPDGRWLAYTEKVATDSGNAPPGWVLDPLRAPAVGDAASLGSVFRVIATEFATGRSVLLGESRDPLTAPAWRPDGLSLAFGRLVRQGDGRVLLEVVVQESLHSQRVVASHPCDPGAVGLESLAQVAPAWSPDGRCLAMPGLNRAGFSVLRADQGRVLRAVDDAVGPAWSPDGSRLAYVKTGPTAALCVLDAGFGPERRLATLGRVFQAPGWSRDGRSVIVVTSRPELRRFGPSTAIELVRVDLESGAKETMVPLGVDPNRGGRAPLAVSYALDREGDDLFYAAYAEGQPSSIVWFRPKTEETVNRFHPLDISTRVGALALAPGGRPLAVRFGVPGAAAPVGVWESTTGRLTPVVPDDEARVAWITLLVRTAHVLLGSGLPVVNVGGRAVARPTLLPIPGELPRTMELTLRLRRLGRIGRPLCDRPEAAPPAAPATEALLREARLFFDYLRDDFTAALASLEAIEARDAPAEQRMRLLSLRSQILLALGERESARDIISYIAAIEARRPKRIETTPAGHVLSEVPSTTVGWAAYLGRKAEPPAEGGPSDESREDDPPLLHRLHGLTLPPTPRPVPFDRR